MTDKPDDTKNSAELLAELTGRDESEFELSDDVEIPGLDELELTATSISTEGSVELSVGDVTIRPDSYGAVEVFRDGERAGRITAQGLFEAANMTDEALAQSWSDWVTDTDE